MQPLTQPKTIHYCSLSHRGEHFTRIEEQIIAGLGGEVWNGPDPTGAALVAAQESWGYLRIACGYDSLGDAKWLTEATAKQKATVENAEGVESMAGVTVLPARGGAAAWLGLELEQRAEFAAALGVTESEIESALRITVCPFATNGCITPCVMTQGQAKLNTNELTHLARTLLMLLRPLAYLELTRHHLSRLADRYGPQAVRWRANMADDVRWELLSPGLFDLGIRALAYTKHPICCRPERPEMGLRIVYSVNELWRNDHIVAATEAGHTVSVVFDLPKHQLPSTHLGVPVVDGDLHDDLHAHPHGVIVGLSAKGSTRAVKVQMRTSGFSRQVEAA